MGKDYFSFTWDIIVNLHMCIFINKICILSDPEVNLPKCKFWVNLLQCVFAYAWTICICTLTGVYLQACIFGACKLDFSNHMHFDSRDGRFLFHTCNTSLIDFE